MPVLSLDDIRTALVDAVIAGARAVLTARRNGELDVRYKDARELVTEADRQSDAAMLAVLHERVTRLDPSVSLRLEESGAAGAPGRRRIGADPLDGTSHFAAGGTMYSVQAHYLEDDVPLAGVVLQPEVFLPLSESDQPVGRLAWAVRGGGAFVRRVTFSGDAVQLHDIRPIVRRPAPNRPTFVASVPVTTKMAPDERASAQRVYESGILAASMGTGNAGGNAMMVIFGGQDVYANLGAGEELDLAPPQVIAEEIGLTVWGPDRRPPMWRVRKQPVVFAPSDDVAERFLQAAGL